MIINNELIRVANTAADLAGQLSRKYFRKNFTITIKEIEKDSKSPVTSVDLAIEKTIRDYIQLSLPNHSILGEELGAKQTNSEYLWIIDPIDGTTSFSCGKPVFSTLIALLKNKQAILGIIDQPITNDRWLGIAGSQSTWNDTPCFSCTNNELDAMRLSCTSPDMFISEKQKQKFAHLKKLALVVSYGGDAYAYGLLASGYIDVILESDLKFYDVAALIPIIEGAGAVITDWQGNLLNIDNFQGEVLVVSNKKLQQKILRVMNHN
jgi:inositol-phosphate phosphatase / L-galactose 1-phosphate phosphatase / histidinol-phosphatase